ncbi:MAG: hypothetical protein RMJ43_03360 [Chloroherpetonaceae bacterium]|nr:hypothetical protein [Chloroherpetonaceae bacterium]
MNRIISDQWHTIAPNDLRAFLLEALEAGIPVTVWDTGRHIIAMSPYDDLAIVCPRSGGESQVVEASTPQDAVEAFETGRLLGPLGDLRP